MKRIYYTALLFLMCGASVLSQPIIITDTVIQTSVCAGSNIIIPFTVIDTAGSFNFGNIFTAQLSDQLGGFSNPVDIGTFPIPWTTSGYILGTIPINSPLIGAYKVRVVGDNPVVVGSECPNLVLIINTATLATINAPDSVICDSDSITLTATPFFSSHQWALNGTNISGAISATLIAYQTGSYTVTVVDTLQCESTSEPFGLTVENCVGVKELSDHLEVAVFPNPCSDVLNISYRDAATVSAKNLLGQQVISRQSFEGDINLDLLDLESGLYFAEIQANGKSITVKFVKK